MTGNPSRLVAPRQFPSRRDCDLREGSAPNSVGTLVFRPNRLAARGAGAMPPAVARDTGARTFFDSMRAHDPGGADPESPRQGRPSWGRDPGHPGLRAGGARVFGDA